MDGREEVWNSLVPRLGGLLRDPKLNVRVNIAMLAGSLAGKDGAALEQLAAICVDTIRRIIREESSDDDRVLEAVSAERDGLGESKAALDKRIAEQLEAHLPNPSTDITSEDLDRLPAWTLPLLPGRVLADAFYRDANRLAANPRVRDDPVERERLELRLGRLVAVENAAPSELRRDLRRGLREHVLGMRGRVRSAVLLVLLQIAPALLQPLAGAPAVATAGQIDWAAWAGRPRLIRVMLRAIFFAFLVVGIVLTILMAAMLSVSRYRDKINIPASALQDCLRIGFISLMAALPAALLYIPSVGRSFRLVRGGIGVLVPALAAGIVSAGVAAAFSAGGVTFGLELHENPIGDHILLFVAVTATVAMVIVMVPPAVRANNRAGDESELRAAGCAVGPAFVAVTLACGIAAWLPVTALSQLWPLLMATAALSAVSLTNIETAASPALPHLPEQRHLRWPTLAAFGSATPVLLLLVGIVVSWLSAEDKSSIIHVVRQGAGHHWTQAFPVTRGSRVTLGFDEPRSTPLRANFSTRMHKVIIGPKGQKDLSPGANIQYVIPPDSTICIDQCPPQTEAWMADWLLLLLTGKPETVDVRAEFTAPVAALKGSPVFDMTKANADYKLAPGIPGTIELRDGRGATLSVKGKGDLGDDPSLAVFQLDKDKKWQEITSYSNYIRQTQLKPGVYQVCVYFGSIEHSGCNLHDPKRLIFETGEAVLSISRTD